MHRYILVDLAFAITFQKIRKNLKLHVHSTGRRGHAVSIPAARLTSCPVSCIIGASRLEVLGGPYTRINLYNYTQHNE